MLAAADSFDQLWNVALAWHEIAVGTQNASTIRDLRENGGLACQTSICVDAMSVQAAVTAQHVKAPAEGNLLGHIQFLRELLDTGVLSQIAWVDTRDMVSDGLTKGSIDREGLHELMKGTFRTQHDVKSWSPPRSRHAAQHVTFSFVSYGSPRSSAAGSLCRLPPAAICRRTTA